MSVSPEYRTLVDFVERGADRFGSRTALKHRDQELSYAELAVRARAFAACLRERGVGPGDRLLLLLENSFDYAIVLFGGLSIGCVIVPVNPETQPETVAYVLENSKARGAIARTKTSQRLVLGELGIPSLIELAARYEDNVEEWFGGASPRLAADPDPPAPDDLAMVLYTSGTTGHPKGVMLSHHNLLANTRSICQYLELADNDSIVNVLPFFYSFGNSILMTHLAVGARIVIENRFMFPAKVVETMQTERPTGFSGVPSTYYILLHKTRFLELDWSFMRYISQAGGGMRVETIRKLRNALPDTEIVIMYGQTEASARLGYLPPGFIETKIGSIGKGIPGVELRVVDEQGNAVLGDAVGEIIARGENIMQGYLDNPEATAQALRDGWLYTGDMARVDDEGFIYIASRKADFIKSASYRIGPAEIEEVVAAVEGVVDAAAFGVNDEILGEAICVCVDCPPERFDREAIVHACRAHLPQFKQPRHIVHDRDIPRTASGKKRYHILRERYRDPESRPET